jgi:hypothetical protein
MSFQLKRVAKLPEGVFSAFLFAGVPFAVTLEHSFENNEPIIADGFHQCTRTRYLKGGYDTFEIAVPGHSRVLFHIGNTEADSEGCVLVAEMFTVFNRVAGVGASGDGFKEFMKNAQGFDTFSLEVS